MSLSQEQQRYTYADYLSWDEDERVELIDGMPIMQATPSREHQKVSRNLFRQVDSFLAGKPCEAYYAPFSVRLDAKEDESDDTVLEPDIVVVCDSSKLDDKGCKGAPDLVIEIMSPSTARYDRMVKFQKYLQAGVREYWIVDPDTKTVQACILQGGLYVTYMYADTGTAPIRAVEGCQINLQDVFAE